MKVKTSVSLTSGLLTVIDKRLRASGGNRSELIEAALRSYLAQAERAAVDARDLEVINKRADRLNEEARDALRYQVAL